jgi:hypothetical protein
MMHLRPRTADEVDFLDLVPVRPEAFARRAKRARRLPISKKRRPRNP